MENLSSKFEKWHQATCRTFSLTECSRIPERSFSGHVEISKVGPLAISSISADAQYKDLCLYRNGGEIRRGPCDDLMLYIVTHGAVGLAQAGRTTLLHSKEMAIYDQSRPFKLQFFGHTDGRIVTIPRRDLLERFPNAAAVAGNKISGDTKIGALASSMLGEIMECGPYSKGSIAGWLSASAVDLIAATLEAEFGHAGAQSGEDPRLRRAKRFLRDNLGEPDISLEVLASAVGIAPRTLNRLFLAEGTTPIRWLWRQRLLESRKALASSGRVQVTDVALAHGFQDLSHFSRAFKKEFGENPGAIARHGGK